MKNGVSNLEGLCVAGITPFTTIDFPGRLAGVFYLQGCSWRCRYCYNSEFWPFPPSGNRIPLEKIERFLESRRGHLDGIVFSGGEPTAHSQLPVWIQAVKDMGFEIGIHTGGGHPEQLRKILPLCDWIGLDVKAPFSFYEKVTQVPGSGEFARQSAALILAGGKTHEFRTTVHPDLLSEREILLLARDLAQMGCKNFVIQSFRGEHCPDKDLRESPSVAASISPELREELRKLFPSFLVRPR